MIIRILRHKLIELLFNLNSTSKNNFIELFHTNKKLSTSHELRL